MNQTANPNFQQADFMQEPWLQSALETLDTANLTADQRMQLEIDIAYRVTYEEGLKAEGKALGIQERNTELALTMLNANEPIDKIVAYSGLTEAQVLRLKG